MIADVLAYYLDGNTLIEHNIVTDSINEYIIEIDSNYIITSNHPMFQLSYLVEPIYPLGWNPYHPWVQERLRSPSSLLLNRISTYFLATTDLLSEATPNKATYGYIVDDRGSFFLKTNKYFIIPVETGMWTMHIWADKFVSSPVGAIDTPLDELWNIISVGIGFDIIEHDYIDTRIEYSSKGFPLCLFINTDSATQILVPTRYTPPRWRMLSSEYYHESPFQYSGIDLTTATKEDAKVRFVRYITQIVYKPELDASTDITIRGEEYKKIKLKCKINSIYTNTLESDQELKNTIINLYPNTDQLISFICRLVNELFESGLAVRNYDELPGEEYTFTETKALIVKSRLDMV